MSDEHIAIVTFGPVEAAVIEYLCGALEPVFRLPVRQAAAELPLTGWDAERQQYVSEELVAATEEALPPGAVCVLGLTEANLYAGDLDFIFGQAEVGGPAAVVSLHHLHPERTEHRPNRALFLRRALIESVHELGHTFGLTHCHLARCVMYFSESIEQSDVKGPGFCSLHRQRLDAALERRGAAVPFPVA